MIINIDHIGLSSNDLTKDGTHLATLGYEKVFEEIGLKNMDIKRPYLQEYTPTHDIVLYRKNEVFDIELLQHKRNTNTTVCRDRACPVPTNAPVPTSVPMPGEGFIFPFNKNNNNQLNENTQLDTFIIHTNDVEKSTAFFQALGFKPNDEQGDLPRLTFTALIEKTSYHILLKKTETVAKYYMDTPGFNSIALVSTNAEKEQRRLKKKGYTTGDIGQITVNNRLLNVFFVTGPSNELIEIISYA